MFPFTEVVRVEGKQRTLAGKLELGGRTTAGAMLRPADRVSGAAFGLLAQVPVFGKSAVDFGKEIGQEFLGADGPAASVKASGGVAEVRLSGPDHDQKAYGSVDLHGPGELTVRGLPRAATVMLHLKRLS